MVIAASCTRSLEQPRVLLFAVKLQSRAQSELCCRQLPKASCLPNYARVGVVIHSFMSWLGAADERVLYHARTPTTVGKVADSRPLNTHTTDSTATTTTSGRGSLEPPLKCVAPCPTDNSIRASTWTTHMHSATVPCGGPSSAASLVWQNLAWHVVTTKRYNT